MWVVDVLERMGGVATRAALIEATDRSTFERALASGDVVLVARGRYALASADAACVAAHRLSGTVSHFSAALRHGWQVKLPPALPHVIVAKNRVLGPGQDVGVSLHRISLGIDDVDGVTTAQDRTLLDCLRSGEFDEGLCVADSAMRDGMSPARLHAIAHDARGPGSVQVRRIAALADGRAANAFESTLRAIALDVPGLTVVPQVSIRVESRFLGRPDLLDERLGIVLHPDDVRSVLLAAVAERTERCSRCRGAA